MNDSRCSPHAGAGETRAPQERNPGRWWQAPVLVGLIAVGPFAALVVTGRQVLRDSAFSDYDSFQVPVREFVRDEMRAGRFPHWIPWLGCGIPLHATGQVGVCYPLLAPLLLAVEANLAIKAALFLHVALAYSGQYRLGRRLNLTPAGAALSGLIVAQGGFLAAHLTVGHVALVFAYALCPWFFSSVIDVCRAPTRRSIVGLAVVGALLLLIGHPQVPYYAFLFGGLWAAGSLVAGCAAGLATAAAGIAAVILSIALAGVQLAPTMTLMDDNAGLSNRGNGEFADGFSLHAGDILRLIVPGLQGNALADLPEYAPPDFFHEKICYLGALTWVLAAAGVWGRAGSGWPRGAAALAALALAIALGRTTFAFDLLGTAFPGLFLFRCPGRCLSVASLLLALLAGRGFDRLQAGREAGPSAAVCIAGLLAGAIGWVAVDWPSTADVAAWGAFARQHLLAELAVSAVVLAAAAAVVRALPRLGGAGGLALAVVVLVLDLSHFNLSLIRFESPRGAGSFPVAGGPGMEFRFVEAPQYPSLDSDDLHYSRMVAAAIRNRRPMVGTNEAGVLPGACERLFHAASRNPQTVLRAAACRHVADGIGGSHWSELADALPRISFAPGAAVAEIDCPLEELTATQIASVASRAAQGESSIETLDDQPQSLVVELQSETAGTLLVADTWYPEWQCAIDGEPVEVTRAFDCFRAVSVPQGSHTVSFRFEPRSFRTGLLSTAAGAVACLLLAVSGVLPRRVAIDAAGAAA